MGLLSSSWNLLSHPTILSIILCLEEIVSAELTHVADAQVHTTYLGDIPERECLYSLPDFHLNFLTLTDGYTFTLPMSRVTQPLFLRRYRKYAGRMPPRWVL
ncbi:hypothetical protein BDN72DRAFT_65755 [Pluteus cervinus]|uniref:Uncharacterized protein n=1 Tax=Pluteus cervinus TaxID=181527 RepID=A0ACD2ZZ50_9AGAR|nr:hypothetical protein BDN72DRAFT_65755 [Pluteus cervinus]